MIFRNYNLRTLSGNWAQCHHTRHDAKGATPKSVALSGNRQAFQHEAAETGASTTTDGVVDHESLQTSAVVGQLTDAVQAQVDNLLTNGVVTTGKVVGGVLLTLLLERQTHLFIRN